MAVILVHLSLIDDNPYQKRQEYGDIAELGRQIAGACGAFGSTYGLLQVPLGRLVADDGLPVPHEAFVEEFGAEGLRPREDKGYYFRVQLLFGHRRKRAFEWLRENEPAVYGAGMMPVQLTDAEDDDMLDAVWRENSQRKNLSEVEEAEMIQAALARHPEWSQRDLADRWGVARPTLSNRLRLLGLPESVQAANRQGRLSERQALALAPMVELHEKLNGRGASWSESKEPEGTWAGTMSPENYIAYATTHPDKVSSDQVREYARRQLRHAGTPIPGKVSSMELGLVGDVLVADVVQATCRGCLNRVQDSCLRPACLKVKLHFYGVQEAMAAAKELKIPYSDDMSHFVTWTNYKEASTLLEAWQAGSCTHLVVGWSGSGYAPRPFADSTFLRSSAGEMERVYGGARSGVTLGCTHKRIGDCAAPGSKAESVAADPLAAAAAVWEQEGAAQVKEIKERTLDALAVCLDLTTTAPDGLRALFFLLRGDKPDRDIYDVRVLARSLLAAMWERGKFIRYSDESAWWLHRAAIDLLSIAELDAVAVLEQGYTPYESMARRLFRVLDRWGHSRPWHWKRREAAELLHEEIAELQAVLAEWPEPGGPDLQKLSADLAAVAAEVEATLRPEGEE